MITSAVVTIVDHRPSPGAGPSAVPDGPGRFEPQRFPSTTPATGAAVGTASAPHRHRAAALIRQLRGRTDAALRRELGRFFATRPDLSHADRAAITRALSRFRNQLLHHPRSTLRAAAFAPDTVGTHPVLDAVRRLFGLADAPHPDPAEPHPPQDRPTSASAHSVA